ncbi:MAG: hypothetical protein KDE53_32310 [Caldilineaceae bacterium]|nr:hypothetical protein [Caldilineaceae bacterium]MCB0125136.1 hypothetical protein [Caldilineaceae bacterium]
MMFAGHLAAGLALKQVDKRVNLGLLFFASLFADFLLGLFILSGLEQVHVPTNFQEVHYLTFTFPYSHGLVATVLWSFLAFVIGRQFWRAQGKQSNRIGFVIGLAVFSHFLLDWIVHVPEMPLLGANSPKLGLGLWNHLTMALIFEALLALIGLVIYLGVVKPTRRVTRYGVPLLMVVVTLATVSGQALNDTPPPSTGAALSWIIQPILLGGIAYWLDRKTGATQQRPN